MLPDEAERKNATVTLRDDTNPLVSKLIYVSLGLLVIYVIVRGLVGAAARPFWYDELLTLAIAGQPSLHDVWNSVKLGFDSGPPGFYLVERAALGFVSNRQIALRLPSILAFPCTLICVFVYVRKRSGEVVAGLCALLLLTTSLFHTYLVDARPYGMVMACIAFALVCYQRLPSLRWAAMLGISLLLAESLHYYAVLAMIPFGLAEAVLLLRTRRFRWPVWIALACGTLPLIVFWRLLWAIKTFYGPLAFGRPAFSALPGYYESFFLLPESAVGIPLAVVSITVIVWSRLWPRGVTPHGNDSRGADLAEGTLLLSLIALPFIVFVLVRPVHGLLLSRYVLATTFGVVVAMACALSIVGRKTAAMFALFVFCSVGIREMRFWHHYGQNPFTLDNSSAAVEGFLQKAGYSNLPIVVGQEILYLPLTYYSSQRIADRLVYLVDAKKESEYERTDTMAKLTLGLREFFPVQAKDYTEFMTTHKEFLLYSESGPEWWLVDLTHQAASVQLLSVEASRQLFLVKMKEDSPR